MIKHPQLNDKIDLMIALAPSSSMAHFKSPLRFISRFHSYVEVRCVPRATCRPMFSFLTCRHSTQKMFELFRVNYLLDRNGMLPTNQRRFCQYSAHRARACRNVIFFLGIAVAGNSGSIYFALEEMWRWKLTISVEWTLIRIISTIKCYKRKLKM